MKLRIPTLAVLISLAALLHGCGGGQDAPSADANTSAKEQAQSWGAYSEGNGQYGQSRQYHVVRSWRNAAGDFTAHLVADNKIGRLTVMSADFSSTLAVLNQGPVVDAPTSVQWIAPNHTEAGILRVGRTLYRMAWNGNQATLSAPIHTLASPDRTPYNHFKIITDAKSVVILDALSLVSISADGALIRQVDLSQTLGVTSPKMDATMAMNDSEVFLLADGGLLSMDRTTGQARWVDQFDGSHAVNQILWATNASVGYRIHLPSADQWHEQVLERLSNGDKRIVADRIMVPTQDHAVAEPQSYLQSGAFTVFEPDEPFAHLVNIVPASHRLQTNHIIWCNLPEEQQELTCKGQAMFAYQPATQTTTAIGTLASSFPWTNPDVLPVGRDVWVYGQQFMEVYDTSGQTDPFSTPSEIWTFDPNVTNSLRKVEPQQSD